MTPPVHLEAETEATFQDAVIELAHLLKWRVAHFRPALTKKGWRTAVGADGKGWPDLVLVRERIIFAELKSDSGTLSPEQREWMIALRAASAEFYVWRPCDWEQIEKVLR